MHVRIEFGSAVTDGPPMVQVGDIIPFGEHTYRVTAREWRWKDTGVYMGTIGQRLYPQYDWVLTVKTERVLDESEDRGFHREPRDTYFGPG